MSDRFLTGRSAWVTGGVTGIGRAIALALAESGANVSIGSLLAGGALPQAAYAALPTIAALDEAAKAIEERGVACFAAGLDLRLDEDVDRFHDQAVTRLGPVDILVNAAGISAQEEMLGHSDETWEAVLDVNLNGPYRTTKRCMRSMIERRWGRIVNIASTAAAVGYPRHSAYCASKSALLGLTRCVALEGAEHGVTCNAINLGWVATEMMRLGSERRIAQGGPGATPAENMALLAETMPQKRLIPAEEVAAFVVFLCRDEALGLTGEAITIAGGSVW
ncbi:MAG: SDR family NAD(P)-dependent oxidoreductase [Pseudomonadota bacterium]|nr:SDR family NAD(P)-dependent oxidoreductase [Pseudomonadota bacterium]